MKWKLLVIAVSGLCTAPAGMAAEGVPGDIDALKRQIDELTRKVQALEESRRSETNVTAVPGTAPRIELGTGGFKATSADSNFVFQLRGLVQVDNRTFFRDGGIQGNDTFLLRRARPIFQGTLFGNVDFMFVPDFGGSSVQIYDAYLNYRLQPWLQLRAGKFKTPVGLEYLQSDPVTAFSERALPTALVPGRDVGFQLWGNVESLRLQYALGVFNGVGDGRNGSSADFEDHREIAGRVFFEPFRKRGPSWLSGLGFGVGGSWGTVSSNSAGLPSGYATDGQQAFFTYTNGVVADGDHWRLAPQAYYYCGPASLLAEYTISDQAVRRGTASRNVRHTAWQVSAGWVLTGEDASFSGVTPKRPFDPASGQWGAVQLVGRYAELDIDNDVFPLFANPSASASAAQAWAVGLN
ncbi:MAG TPA: porin, partial [Verrucomicrobiota bacterium]|nr:porin [Verrucomicrobiota bacterium]